MASTLVTVLTGTYPTADPRTITESVAAMPGGGASVDARVRVASGTDTFRLLAWAADVHVWEPISSMASDSTATGGVASTRQTLSRSYSHACIWRDAGSVTPTEAWISVSPSK